MSERSDEFVVIGAGSAGSAIVRRLIDAGRTVHVIEAGATDEDPSIHSPQGWPALFTSPNDWAVMTTPQEHLGGRVLYWPRGRVLGGSSSLNGMIYMRGDRSDYDTWKASGAVGWSWDEVLPYFRRSEDHVDGADAFHGAGGPLRVERIPQKLRHPVATAFVDAAVEAGIERTDDFNRERLDGVGFNHTTTRDGRRASAWQAFVAPVLGFDRLTVTTDALVTRVVVEDGRATGVEYVADGVEHVALATQEVVLSAGAIGSPAILLRSGIGPRPQLESLGIPVVADLPGVGENLHDHLLVSVLYSAKEPVVAGRWNLLESQLYARSSVCEGPTPDLQPLCLHMPYPADGGDAPEQGYTIAAGIVRPHSRGTIRLASADPTVAPLVDPNVFADDLAVVDPALRVRGIAGLRVADASIMPIVPSANTNAPSIMVGEKASDLLLGASSALDSSLAGTSA